MSSELELRGSLYRYQQRQSKKKLLLRRNDEHRGQFIDNDEGLYDWWKSSKLSQREFIRQNRHEIDVAIDAVVSGEKPAHHLKYGG